MINKDVLTTDYTLHTDLITLTRECHGIYATDLLSAAIKSAGHQSALVTLISHDNTIACAMMIDCPLVIITSDRMVSQSMIDKANEENICLLSTHLHTHEVIRDLLVRGLI